VRKISCYQQVRLNSEFFPVCLKRLVVDQSSCVFDRLLLSLMFVCEKDSCLIFECILSCYGQCKVVKCCLCTVCLMSHIFMYSNIHTQCIIHLLLWRKYLSCLCLCLLKNMMCLYFCIPGKYLSNSNNIDDENNNNWKKKYFPHTSLKLESFCSLDWWKYLSMSPKCFRFEIFLII